MRRTVQGLITIMAIAALGATYCHAGGSGRISLEEVTGLEKATIRLSRDGTGPSDQDLYMHLYAACLKENGRPVFVVPKKNGKYKVLTEVDSSQAFDYIETDGGVWYMACNGPKMFMVRRNYSFPGRAATADVFPRRGLEGVDYVKDGYTVPERVYTSAYGIEPFDREGFLKGMAREVATVKVDFLKPHKGSRFRGYYNGAYGQNGCDRVSIKDESRSRVHDFRVCSSSVAKLDERDIKENNDGTKGVYANAEDNLTIRRVK